jgi:hypothetical protein
VELADDGVSDGSSDGSTEALLAAVGVWTTSVGVAVAVAALSLSETCDAERTFVDVPSSRVATARQTTRLVTAVARSHDAAATAAIRLRDLFLIGRSLRTPEKGAVKEQRKSRPVGHDTPHRTAECHSVKACPTCS